MQDFIKANYHAHTWRCQHAYDTEREYIEAAIEMGIMFHVHFGMAMFPEFV